MSVSSINYSSSVLGQSVQNLNNQLTNLSTELSTGVKSQTYAGMGVNEGFAIAARSQLSNITAFGDTMTNVNTIISAANTSLETLSTIGGQVQSAAAGTPAALDSSGQTVAQENAASELSSIVGVLNTQVGNRYIFSGSAINTPAVASVSSIMNGSGTDAGLKQVMAEREQADLGTNGMGRVVISQPTSTSVQVAEDVAGSPFGLKLNAVSSSLTGGATVTGPSGSPAAISVALGATNPSVGDQVSFTFTLPDGTTQAVQLTATNTTPPPTGSFLIGATPTDTATNLNTALTSSISTLANTSLVAASAVEAGDNFFNTDSTATGSVATNQASPAAPITGATALSGGTGTDSLSSSFANNDTITVNGKTITFSTSAATSTSANGGVINLSTGSVQDVLSAIDEITGTSTPSTVSGGVVTLHTDDASNFSITTSNSTALGALGFSGGSISALQPPLRVSGTPLGSATSLVSGASDTVAWYTGNSGPGSARATSSALIDSSETVDFGAQANEQAIRTQLQNIAVFAAFTASPTGTHSAGQISALSQSIATNLTPQASQQSIADIQTDFANAQTQIQSATARQTQTQTMMQNLVDQTENISQNQVASELLSLQNSLQASYQATSMLSQLSLVKYLPAGG
jgi:flagellar hook-associated protein 3 FlgL